jgi:hypothetical protein
MRRRVQMWEPHSVESQYADFDPNCVVPENFLLTLSPKRSRSDGMGGSRALSSRPHEERENPLYETEQGDTNALARAHSSKRWFFDV